MRYEKGIGISTNFVTHHGVHGTVYRDTITNIPEGYVSGGNSELFLGFLEHLHTRTVESKEGNLLISPAIFDPNSKTEESTKRGMGNIVVMRHLWMDFENGDLHPEEIAELFPRIRLAVFTTYNHTKENPRFRVVIPFDELISPENYIVLYDNVIAKLEDAGYSVGKAQDGMRSGLDVPKKSPTSLFYLPCQAKAGSDSFFHDYNDGKREILDPMKWINNTVVHFRPADAKGKIRPSKTRGVDQAAVAKATRIWRESRQHRGEGNTRFFEYAVSLRTAGMSLDETELKLAEEAKSGRSPRERTSQIPSIMKTLRNPIKKSA